MNRISSLLMIVLLATGLNAQSVSGDDSLNHNIKAKKTAAENPEAVKPPASALKAGEIRSTELLNTSPDSVNTHGIYQNLQIYPSPTKGNFHLSVELLDKTNITLAVFDGKGQLAYLSKKNNIKNRFDAYVNLSDFPSGVYHLNLKIGEELIQRSIVLKH